MCDHYKLDRTTKELKVPQVKGVLTSIQLLGTRTVIISGGEPLARRELGEILEHAATECKLHVGMITNGVSGSFSQGTPDAAEPIQDELAKRIAASCDWVQLSIDSLNSTTYKAIRGVDVEIAKSSLEKLSREMGNGGDGKRLEMCYTIQQENVGSLEEDLRHMDEFLGSHPNVVVRLKIAHGPENGNARFVPTSDQVEQVITILNDAKSLGHASRMNINYLLDVIDNHFGRRDLSDGKPLVSRMAFDYRQRNYLCYVMRLFCFINANGDVYPCCFLFDDNHADSRIRERYKIGSLTGLHNITEQNNPLKRLWYTNDLWNVHRRVPLPVDSEACSYCTRFFYQNELLNQTAGVLSEYARYGLAEKYLETGGDRASSEEPYWL